MQTISWLTGKSHIPDSLWRQYDYLDLYPLDGGASFIVDEYAQTRSDREVVAKLLSGELLRAWGGDPENLDWFRHFGIEELELNGWLQRWYFVPSIARVSFLDGDEKLAQIILTLFSEWEKHVGYPKDKDDVIAREEKSLNWDYKFQRGLLSPEEQNVPWEWYDFQPAYRLLVLLVTVQFLRNSPTMIARSDDLLRWIAAHANSILWITQHYGYKYGNHHTLRMMCMYLAGALVQHENAQAWRETALEMQTRHIGEDFFDDGMYKESLPGYTPFIITHFREVLLSALANGRKVPDIFEQTLRRALRMLKTLVMPDGYLPVINDGPRVNITGMIELIEHYLPASSEKTKTFHLNKPSGFSVFRDDHNYLVFDANYAEGSHVQAGKLGFILWRDSEPFIIEGGCCNYDNPDFQPYFRRGWAHSTLLVDGEEDAIWKSFWVWQERAHPVIVDSAEGDQPFVRATSDGFKRLGVDWTRTIAHPDGDSFIITDEVKNESAAPRAFTFRFIVAHDDVETDPDNHQARIKGKNSTLTLTASLDCDVQTSRVKSNFFGDMREVPCIDFVVKSAEDFTQTFTLTFS